MNVQFVGGVQCGADTGRCNKTCIEEIQYGSEYTRGEGQPAWYTHSSPAGQTQITARMTASVERGQNVACHQILIRRMSRETSP